MAIHRGLESPANKNTCPADSHLKTRSSAGRVYLSAGDSNSRLAIRACILLSLLLSCLVPLHAQEANPADTLTVTAEGMAAIEGDMAIAEDEALWDAKRNAIEQAAGVFLRARSVGRDFVIEEKTLRARSDGFIRRWERVPDSRQIETVGNGRILRIKIRAEVALLPVIQKLSDIKDVYDDLERPRLRVEVIGDTPAGTVRNALLAHLRALDFEVTTGSHAEVSLVGRLEIVPTVKMGSGDSPFGVGDNLAACRAKLTLRLISEASEETLFVQTTEGAGRSFVSDADARTEAAADAVDTLVDASPVSFTQTLMVRWVREREEGHAIQLTVSGLSGHQRALLVEQISRMRGFVRMIGTTTDSKQFLLRFITRLDTPGVRRRLSALPLEKAILSVQNGRGTRIICTAKNEVKR